MGKISVSSRSNSTLERRVVSLPWRAMEMWPVSSETTTATASVAWEMPRAERWRRPR